VPVVTVGSVKEIQEDLSCLAMMEGSTRQALHPLETKTVEWYQIIQEYLRRYSITGNGSVTTQSMQTGVGDPTNS